jgi:hypothetical protein
VLMHTLFSETILVRSWGVQSVCKQHAWQGNQVKWAVEL